jgi:hypothetical protein
VLSKRNDSASSTAANEQEINHLLSSMPADWKNQLASSRSKLRAAGAPTSALPPEKPTAQTVLRALNLNNQGSISSEAGVTQRGEPVPGDVRAAAMEGIRQSWKNNYGGYDFIGVARAIQLAISPRISAQAKNRMRMYFDRKTKQDRLSDQYRQKNGRRYWSWLNWGGDPGARWSGSSKFKQLISRQNPKPVLVIGAATDSGGMRSASWRKFVDALLDTDHEWILHEIKNGNVIHYDMDALPERGDALDHFHEASAVLGDHLYFDTIEPYRLGAGYYYNTRNQQIVDVASRAGVPLFLFGDHPSRARKPDDEGIGWRYYRPSRSGAAIAHRGKSNPSRNLLYPEKIHGRVWTPMDAALAFMRLPGDRAASALQYIQSQKDLVFQMEEPARQMRCHRPLSLNQIRALASYWVKPWIFSTSFNRKLGNAAGLSAVTKDDPQSWADVKLIAHWAGKEVVFTIEPATTWLDVYPAPRHSDQRLFLHNGVTTDFSNEQHVVAVQKAIIERIRSTLPELAGIDLNLSVPSTARPNAPLHVISRGAVMVSSPRIKQIQTRGESLLYSILSRDHADRVIDNRIRRDGDHAHVTLLSPADAKSVIAFLAANTGASKKQATQDLHDFVQQRVNDDMRPRGVGTVLMDTKEAFFVSLEWPSGQAIRKELGLPVHDEDGAQHFHITLGFGDEGDVHGVPKQDISIGPI